MNPLRELTIEHLRGSVKAFSLPFERGKKLTVIYGENGTGKSTICDAFEFLSRGKVSSLENRGLGQTLRFWPSIGKAASDVSVTLAMSDGECRATITKNGDVFAAPPEKRPRAEVFRKSPILSLIEAKPGERYAAISRFIDVSGIEASEAALRDLIRDLKRTQDLAIAGLSQNEETIRQFWETAGRRGKDPFAWAEAECERGTDVFEAESAALNALQGSYARVAEIPDRLRSAQQALKTAEKSAADAAKTLEESLKSTSKDAAEVVAVLQAAQAYLAKTPAPALCPLCESSEKTTDLANRIQQRLTAFSALQLAQSKAATAKLSVQRAEQQLEVIRNEAGENVKKLEEILGEFTWPKDIRLPQRPVPNSLSALADWLKDNVDLPGEWRKAEVERHDRKQFIGTLRQSLKTWRENTTAQKELAHLIPRLEKSLQVVMDERRRFTDEILASISAEVGRLYEAVHPGEGLNKISLELDPKKRASLEIGASFCGKETRPQAYFSDSHLDTLGLCVFLALSALEEPADKILILDDVLASVDEPHVDRLIEMLYSEAIKFRHCIITTHYRPWKEKLRWGWLQNGQCQFIELMQWTPEDGLALIRSVPDIERLKKLLEEKPPDLQSICSKAGVILEAALNFLTLHYECSAPRRSSGLYTLGELLNALDKKLRQALRIEVLLDKDKSGNLIYKTVNLKDHLDELTGIAQTRNVFGCHFNELSFQLLDSDALNFGRQVVELMNVLTDGDAGWPRSDKSGEYWATAGETRKLYPFKRPS
jgi:ABC-type molybdenum transport system ATPase subunit/photorepair protein PhrA